MSKKVSPLTVEIDEVAHQFRELGLVACDPDVPGSDRLLQRRFLGEDPVEHGAIVCRDGGLGSCVKALDSCGHASRLLEARPIS